MSYRHKPLKQAGHDEHVRYRERTRELCISGYKSYMLIQEMTLFFRSHHLPFTLELINGPQCAKPTILVLQKNLVLPLGLC